MQTQRKRILQMLENGTISMDEALTLLENLQEDASEESKEVEQESLSVAETKRTTEEQEKTTGQEKKEEKRFNSFEKEASNVDDFFNELRKDFTMVGDRFMHFMQTAVDKVKEMDLEAPFGRSFVFTHTITHDAEGIDDISLIIPSGKVTIHASSEEDIRAELTVKAYHKESEEDAKKEILEKISVTTKNDTFKLESDLKVGQVDVDLYVPNHQYKTVEARLTNGKFKASHLTIERIHVKATNGEIQLKDITGDKVDAETLNGRVYIDGHLRKVEAQSLNGTVVVTTTSEAAERIEAKTVSGSVELYIPSTISLLGELSSTVGKLDLGLKDVERMDDEDQLFQKSVRFYKEVPEKTTKLRLSGNAKTGTVLVRYMD